jgi:hypothetical protein
VSCPSPSRIAAAASGEDETVLAHVANCIRCELLLDDQREVRALTANMSRSAPRIALSRSRREQLGAEVLAAVDQLPGPRRANPARTAVVASAAAAAAIAVVLGISQTASPPAVAPVVVYTPEPVANLDQVTQHEALVPSTEPEERQPPLEAARGRRAQLAGDAEFAERTTPDRDVVELHSGELTVDALDTRPVEIVTQRTAVTIRNAKVAVIARQGVIHTVTVIAGSAEVITDGHHELISAGTIWERDAARDDALAAFRAGWTAKRQGRGRDAIAAFDRATHAVVAEDAAYWAAVESERAGTADARDRYRAFLVRFPGSVRASSVERALDRLASPHDAGSAK